MKKQNSRLLLLLTALVPLAAGVQSAHSALAIGLTATGLISFDTNAPGVVLGTSTFTGLSAGDTIVDIDYFPSNGLLYGAASSGRLYTINPITGSAIVDTSAGAGNIGTVTDADFNPMANRLRIFSAGDANYRITPSTGVITPDGTFAYVAGDVNAGANPNLRGSAYTNSFSGTTATSLYSIDSDTNSLVLHSGAAAFSGLNTVALLTLNGLTLNIGDNVGFDIGYFNGVNTAFLTNGNALYDLDLATGDLLPLGNVGPVGGPAIFSMAVGLQVPEPGSAMLSTAAVGLLALRRRRVRA